MTRRKPNLTSCAVVFRLAAEYGLEPVYKKEFHQVFEEHQDNPEFAQLLQRMHVVDSNGESHMDEDQWDAASEWPCSAGAPSARADVGPQISTSGLRSRSAECGPLALLMPPPLAF